MRAVFTGIAWISVAVGVVGIFVPLLPITPFLLLSCALFARSSPRFEAWLVDHPTLGPPVRRWREHGAIPRSAKVVAGGSMATSFLALVWADPGATTLALVAVVLSACCAFVFTRPST